MKKEWIRTEEECHLRILKRLSKQQKKMNSKIQRKKTSSYLLNKYSVEISIDKFDFYLNN
jgi:hypothetical protein